MTEKEEVLQQLKASRMISVVDNHNVHWKKAFELYNRETGNNLSMKCNKCFTKVSEWLHAKP
jgi:hypothetical protein